MAVALGFGCADATLAPPCAVSELTAQVAVAGVNRLDVLFVIDNSEAMAPHRALLEQELPRMIEMLVTGDSDPTDDHEPASLADLHVGFVSTDMGDAVVEDQAEGCSARGDRAALQTSAECGAQDQPFVWHFHDYHDSDASIAAALCNAALDPGCSVAQPLESALAAAALDLRRRLDRGARARGWRLALLPFSRGAMPTARAGARLHGPHQLPRVLGAAGMVGSRTAAHASALRGPSIPARCGDRDRVRRQRANRVRGAAGERRA